MTWQIITGECPPVIGGVSGYSQIVAEGLADAGDEVQGVPAPASPAGVQRRDGASCAGTDLTARPRAVDRLLDRFPPPRRPRQWHRRVSAIDR
jgi:hypothetical protein